MFSAYVNFILIILLFVMLVLQHLNVKRMQNRIITLTDIMTDISRRTNNTTAKLLIIEARLNMGTLTPKEAVEIEEGEETDEH